MLNTIFIHCLDKNNHLKNVCMSYYQHFYFSSKLGFHLLLGSVKAFIHAIIPMYCTTSTSNLVTYLDTEMKNTGCK